MDLATRISLSAVLWLASLAHAQLTPEAVAEQAVESAKAILEDTTHDFAFTAYPKDRTPWHGGGTVWVRDGYRRIHSHAQWIVNSRPEREWLHFKLLMTPTSVIQNDGGASDVEEFAYGDGGKATAQTRHVTDMINVHTTGLFDLKMAGNGATVTLAQMIHAPGVTAQIVFADESALVMELTREAYGLWVRVHLNPQLGYVITKMEVHENGVQVEERNLTYHENGKPATYEKIDGGRRTIQYWLTNWRQGAPADISSVSAVVDEGQFLHSYDSKGRKAVYRKLKGELTTDGIRQEQDPTEAEVAAMTAEEIGEPIRRDGIVLYTPAQLAKAKADARRSGQPTMTLLPPAPASSSARHPHDEPGTQHAHPPLEPAATGANSPVVTTAPARAAGSSMAWIERAAIGAAVVGIVSLVVLVKKGRL